MPNHSEKRPWNNFLKFILITGIITGIIAAFIFIGSFYRPSNVVPSTTTVTSAPATIIIEPSITSAPATATIEPSITSAPTDTLQPTTTIAPPTSTHSSSITSLPPPTFVPPPTFPPPTSVPLPQFPWPVPKPSAFTQLPLGTLGRQAGSGATFHDVDLWISSALGWAGYDEKSYFAAPDGFAIVTRLEKMDEDGFPEYGSNRWISSMQPISFSEFSLLKYLEALFTAPKGHYRVMVFIVTSEIIVQSGTPVAQAEAQTWIVQGANRLPFEMEGLPYTNRHTTAAYIYEFIQTGVGADVNQNIPSEFTGREHLERADLWDSLNADCPSEVDQAILTYGSVVRSTICPPDDVDRFTFSGTSGDKVHIQVDTDDVTLPCIRLHGPSGTIFGGCEHEITITLHQSGRYSILIDHWPTRKIGDYTLELEQIQ